ncbi:N-acetyl-gamma-glutamyl-phosphate/LysW-gamma-L-alpha-aminoadipyl-6-phosphate reductase [Streptosporangium becharense]|uniref:N-acetyl-gamma-glutamyl-phosphate reductase n=1 Tax=Streptosporangium becharense TaxID=1816182 RepID=A0A7W9IML9_9ACTN|nr:N-acetyl-gamma-glutamyl-phosphate reductase [Streptosporangium becharense]MBB2910417.1 N-acetyl-gamma-glutamyl-phosphate/LysW-gamma-L-alpha-aminoadipyl-6-phosphate reductase [Streptosporangium becharense]MBB5823160.1 N-acetyl-gamma-glutamyl-phosphate/LysW-gamma-L-alpha-aminoadipyl-6-phosphate reductase [Streptosporangium becharense]
MRAVVLGGTGYVGGELIRLLLHHPKIELAQAASRRLAGRPLRLAHPNLRHVRHLAFTDPADLRPADVLFCALPPGETAAMRHRLAGLADVVVDLSPDFRLRDQQTHERVYGPAPGRAEAAAAFVPGLPELYRDRLAGARRVSVPGCMATAAILALTPLAEAGLVEGEALVDARTGSSGSGATATAASHHAERAGAMRVYGPAGHRHEAEISQACGVTARMTVTAVPRVRGVQVVAHVSPRRPISRAELLALFRGRYAGEPFVRLVADRSGVHRMPDPKILDGANFCDIGVAADADGRRVVVVAALDNLVKGAAGGAVQSANLALGLDETAGLDFPGLHPV